MNRAGRRVELRRGARSVAACVRVRAYLPLFRLYVLHALTRALGEVLVGAHRTSGNGVDPVVPNGQVSGKSCGSFLNKQHGHARTPKTIGRSPSGIGPDFCDSAAHRVVSGGSFCNPFR